MSKKVYIAPSILSANLAQLEKEVRAIEEAGADWIHVDVMDGHFVPNLTFGAPIVRSLKPVTELPLDVHLMIQNPESHIEDFIQAGASSITAHIEVLKDPLYFLKSLKKYSIYRGLAIKPKTKIEEIYPYLEDLDMVLVMSVEPGFSGQKFMDSMISKVNQVSGEIEKRNLKVKIEVDGGINEDTISLMSKADVFVSGHYIFKHDSYKKAITTLKNKVQNA